MQRRFIVKAVALTAGLLLAAAAVTPAAAGPSTPNRGRYAALGDSYAAGVGVTPSEAYPALLAGKLNKVTFLAESGATTVDVLTEQVPMIPATATQVTLTVGGNDIGFATVALACAADPTACAGAVAAVPAMQANLAALIAAITAQAPQATVYVTGYPHLFQPVLTADGPYCPTMSALSAATAQADGAVTVLNGAIAHVAGQAGATYVPVDVPAGLCTAPDGYIFAPAPDGMGGFLPRSLHPTAAGQQAYADAIEGAGFPAA